MGELCVGASSWVQELKVTLFEQRNRLISSGYLHRREKINGLGETLTSAATSPKLLRHVQPGFNLAE